MMEALAETVSGAHANANAFGGRRVLVTGGLGFIGSRLSIALTELGARVTVVDTLAEGGGGRPFNVEPIRDRIQLALTDAADMPAMRDLIAGQDYVFHLAARTSHADSMRYPAEDLGANCGATLGVLEAARDANPEVAIVYASTRQVYGRPEALPVDESHPTQPLDINGIHKLAAEHYCALYHRVYGLRIRVVRLTNTYGPRMRISDARQMFLGAWIRAAVERRGFDVWGGAQIRDLTFVDDAVDALLGVARTTSLDGDVVNVGGEAVRLGVLAQLLADVSGAEYAVTAFPSDRRAIDIGNYVANDGKLRRAVGWSPRTPLREGLTQTMSYYREHIARYV